MESDIFIFSNRQSPLGHMELVTTASCGISHTSFCKGGNNHKIFLVTVELDIFL